jgi:ubiquinone/menaquinone biosynthesis C-methylase UbiE
LIARHIGHTTIFVEIGCGDAALSVAAAKYVGVSVGVDVTDALLPAHTSNNFQFVKTDGVKLDFASGSVDFAYSNQLMEHLHPDDAQNQLTEIRRILEPGGKYHCVTPSRLTGPHDISLYFDHIATGFHLREYDYQQLRMMFRQAGFRSFQVMLCARGRQVQVPYIFARFLEVAFGLLPHGIRSRFALTRLVSLCFGMNVIGIR